MASTTSEHYGLGEPAMLEKIDKLFACGVGESVDLPQIVVVGDQSSGKSSVLEGLINKPLPRDSGLCTRFATQIVFRRSGRATISVSIIPDRNASQEHSSRVKAWGKVVPSLDSKAFAEIMEQVHVEMGLSGEADDIMGERKPTFSNDVLHLEIAGPDQEHLSVIDVPGIFKSTTEGVTTKADIELVRAMVKGYMDNPRSVMLAVIPANVDVATQEILELAREADEHGDRTLGVLTKPDLVDRGAEMRVIDLMEGCARAMKLGWHMIRNPGQLDLSKKGLDRGALEKTFFRTQSPWNTLAREKVGVDSLRLRLKEVLSSLVKREFPKVRGEIKARLDVCKKQLSDLGPERKDSTEQIACLTRLATKFQRLVSLALSANYGADELFNSRAELRIAPAVMSRMKIFSDEMSKYGEAYSFLYSDGQVPIPTSNDGENASFNIRKEDDLGELVEILHPQDSLPYPHRGDIKVWLLEVFEGNRGFELGTFNATILATAMKKQSTKWTVISMGYVSDIIVMVHTFITTALASICTDRDILNALVATLSEELFQRYQRAIENTRFLLDVENSNTPMTMNHYFNDNLQKSRQGKVVADLKKNSFDVGGGYGNVIKIDHAQDTIRAHSMDNDAHVIQDIHDILKSYYKVSRKTFVDNICKQTTNHFLLNCDQSPLALFSPVFVSQLSAIELEEIAGEAPGLKRDRARVTKEIASLTEAMKILTRA